MNEKVKEMYCNYDKYNQYQTDIWNDFVIVALKKADDLTKHSNEKQKEIVMNAVLLFELPAIATYKRRWECDAINKNIICEVMGDSCDIETIKQIRQIVEDDTNSSESGQIVFASYYESLIKGASALFIKEFYDTGNISLAVNNTIQILSSELEKVDGNYTQEATIAYENTKKILEAKEHALKDNMIGSIINGDLGIEIEECGCN